MKRRPRKPKGKKRIVLKKGRKSGCYGRISALGVSVNGWAEIMAVRPVGLGLVMKHKYDAAVTAFTLRPVGLNLRPLQ